MSVMLNYLFNLGSGFTVGFFVGMIISGIIFIGRALISSLVDKYHEYRMSRVDCESMGVLDNIESLTMEYAGCARTQNSEERANAWAKINSRIRANYILHDHVEIASGTYQAIPYKVLVKTLKANGYQVRDSLGGPFFTKSDYDNGYRLRIKWR